MTWKIGEKHKKFMSASMQNVENHSIGNECINATFNTMTVVENVRYMQ